MKKRSISIAAVVALAGAGILIPAASASASPLISVTITLVHPNGVVVGSSLDATGSIELVAFNSNGDVDFDHYYEATSDPDFYPDGTRVGPLVNGTATFSVAAGDDVEASTFGGPDYLDTYDDYGTSNSSFSATVKTIKGASFSGHVVTPGHSSLQGAVVSAIGQGGSVWGSATTDSLGNYTIRGLITGKYKLQYNSRTSGFSSIGAVANYDYNYWNNKKSWGGGSWVNVTQQTKTKSASVKTGYNDTVLVGHTLTVHVTLGSTPNEYGEANIAFFGKHNADTSTGYLNSTGTVGFSKLAKDEYKINIFDDNGHNWYWAGSGKPVTKSWSKAKWYSFGNTRNVTISFKH